MIEFEWDPAKAKSNERKHGVTFEDATLVFQDPDIYSEQDRIVDGELRWQSTGLVHGIMLVLVAHTSDFSQHSHAGSDSHHFGPKGEPKGAYTI